MKHRLMIKWLCALLALILCLPAAAWAEQSAASETGTLRVLLKSLGETDSLNITLSGSYTLNENTDFRLDRTAPLRVTAVNGEVWLAVSGMALNMGESVTLTRHEADGLNGLYIEGSPRNKLYCGSLRLTASKNILRPVLLIDLEEYLYGVVPYEMSDSFPIEALKAQAVAARTYALQRRAARAHLDYDVVDTTSDQVFMGFDPEYVHAIEAVDATRGVCGLYKGEYATCYYTASNGGQTALARDILSDVADDSYLAIADDPYDLENPKSPVTSLTLRKDAYEIPESIASSLKGAAAEWLSANDFSEEQANIFLDEITDISFHTPLGGEPNRMYQYMRVTFRISACPMLPVYTEPTVLDRVHALFGHNTHTPVLLGYKAGDPVLLEEDFVCDIGVYDHLKDDLKMQISYIDCELPTVFTRQGEECMEFVVELRRFGHGVGMSQRGAQQMASQHGKGYMEILNFYYPGLTFETRQFAAQTLPSLAPLPENVALGSKSTVNAQKELPELKEGEHHALVTLSTAWSTLNMRAAPSTEAAIVTTLMSGWRVIVMEEAEGWAHVRTADHEGYVATQYLTKES